MEWKTPEAGPSSSTTLLAITATMARPPLHV